MRGYSACKAFIEIGLVVREQNKGIKSDEANEESRDQIKDRCGLKDVHQFGVNNYEQNRRGQYNKPLKVGYNGSSRGRHQDSIFRASKNGIVEQDE